VSDGVTVKVEGLDALVQELRKLSRATQERIVKGAMAKSASVIRREAIARAPVWTGEVSQGHPPPGTLKRAIYQARMVMKCTDEFEVWTVNVKQGKNARNTKRGKTTMNLDAFYARWVEYGHYTRAPASAGATGAARRRAVAQGTQLVKGARFVLPQPFMRPAFELKKAEAMQVFQSEFMARTRLELETYRILGIK
jgi:HK97 gp10 family phage protein